ncbi:hypothetical protein M501DRAFT_1002903 [Patellaria atrata CBS 101060]|uniref:Uncharacterized protein n=1 Tax=Patellaria atrata CBS 101060 TaxID=1346257 RepID=A0A9P4SBQ3_9PEZI|nr:hypothetical protein M501DRAFT_1002903 [Patellaria atrata CBS 101060]
MPTLEPRRSCYYDALGRLHCRDSAWDSWARWVVLVVLIVLFVILCLACSCLTARRRRKAGRNPYYGTGWMARGTHYNSNQQPHYQQQQQGWEQPAPPYSASPGHPHGGYYGQQNGQQYGQQSSGIELQAPQQAYHGGDNVYNPPAGPPPNKGDGIIR